MPELISATPGKNVSQESGTLLKVLNRFLGVFPLIVSVFCVVFGLCIIFNVFLQGDGSWYWYAISYIKGDKIYSEMGLAQQPLYILIQAATIKLFGTSWLAIKWPAVATLLMYVAGIHFLVQRLKLSILEKCIVILFMFAVGIHFEAYRFDDYHALVDTFVILTYNLLFLLWQTPNKNEFIRIGGLGCLAGLTVGCRLNDGLILVAVTALILSIITPADRWKRLCLYFGVTGGVLLLLLLLTGDSFTAWWKCSVVGAASIKGGASHLLMYVVMLPANALQSLWSMESGLGLLQVAGTQLLIWMLWKAQATRPLWRIPLALVVVATLILLPYRVSRDPVITVSALCVMLVPVGLVLCLIKLFREKFGFFSSSGIHLLLLPLGLWASGAISSGGWHYGLYFQFAMFAVILIGIRPKWMNGENIRVLCCSTLAFLAFYSVLYRYYNPCSWQSYRSAPMFKQRSLVCGTLHGKMYIDQKMYGFFREIEGTILNDGKRELLSIPMPGINYFTDIHPWKNYVQTFFDTSGEQVISKLMDDLRKDPPSWILYQRQLDNLADHEKTFNGGLPLPHRRLDEFIIEKLQSHSWAVRGQWIYGRGSVWILIRTQPPSRVPALG